MKNKKKIGKILSLIITIVFSCLVLYKIDFSEMASAFRQFDYRYFFFLIPFFLIIMIIRSKRWDYLLPKHSCNDYDLYEIYMVSNLFNIFLPARAGDILRGCYFGQKYNLSKLNVLGTIAAERIFDGLTVIGMLLLGIILHNKSALAVQLALISSGLFVFSFLFMLWVYKYKKIDSFCDFTKNHLNFLPEKMKENIIAFIDKVQPLLNSFVQGFDSFANFRVLTKVTIFSILAWLFDCIYMYILIVSFGIHVSFIITLFILSFIALSTIIPSSSVYIGLYQYAFILAAEIFGIDKSHALTISIMFQGTMLIGYFIIYGVSFVRNQLDMKEIKEEIELENK